MATVPSLTKRTPVALDVIYGAQSPFGGGDDAKFTMSDVQNFVNGVNVFLIEAESDFPVQDATTITLESGYYFINATIVTSKRFIIDTDAAVRFEGASFSTSGVVYTGTDAMVTGTSFLSMDFDNVFLSSPAVGSTTFDIQPGVKNTSGLFLIESALVDCDDLGTIKNIGSFSTEFSSILDCGDGVVIDTVDLIFVGTTQINGWKNRVGAVMYTIQGTVIDLVFLGAGIRLASNETFLDIKAALTITSGSITGTVIDISLGGSVFAAGSKDQTDIKFKYGVNTNIPDSRSFGNMNLSSSETVTITTQSVAVVINDTNTGGTNIWTDLGKERFSFNASTGRLTYTGIEDVNVNATVTSTITKVGGGTEEIATSIFLNGTQIAESISVTQNATPTNVTSIANKTVSTGDFFEIAVQNNGSTDNITVDISNFIIS